MSAGLLAYAFVAIVTRTIGAEAAAPIAVLWTYWSAAAAILVFPLQHWIVRRVSAEGGEEGVRGALSQLAFLVVCAAVCVCGVSWIFGETLFGRDDVVFPLATAGVTLGAGFIGIVRGRLASRQRFVATAGVITGENALRVVAASIVATMWPIVEFYAAALVAGALIGLVYPTATKGILSRPYVRRIRGVGFLGGIAGSSLVAQLTLTGAPVVLTLISDVSGNVTSLFAALALYRAPYLVALGLVTQLTGYLTNFVITGREAMLRRVRWLAAGGTPVLSAAGGILAYFLGPDLVSIVFGKTVQLPAIAHAWLAVGTVVALVNLVLTLQLVARRMSEYSLTSWLFSVIVGAIVIAIVGDPLSAVVAGFVAAELLALSSLLLCDAVMPEPPVVPRTK